MLTYTYVSEGNVCPDGKTKAGAAARAGRHCKGDPCQYLLQRSRIKHGSVPRAVPGITVGHEMVGIVEEVGSAVTNVKPGDRVTVNVETFCGECFSAKKAL